MPSAFNWSSENRTEVTGIAKPTPELLPELDAICSLIPISSPFASSSGPPELPGLIEASVWIALSMPKLVSPSTVRFVAEITPIESDWSSPNGLPIAATGSPTVKLERSESSTGCRSRPSGSTLISATSASASKPLISAGTRLRSPNSTKTCLASCGVPPPFRWPPLVTTWALVTMSPSLSTTNPDPWPAEPPPPRTSLVLPSKTESIVTTPGETSL